MCMQNLLIMMIAVVLVLVLVYLCVFQIIMWKIYDIVAFDGNSKKKVKERERIPNRAAHGVDDQRV